MKIRPLAGAAAATLVLALGALYALAHRAPIAPLAAIPASEKLPAPARLAAGARIVALGDCMVCHTAKDGAAYAGGLGLRTPFGTIYSTNITPDPETGIGRWSAEAFRRALREGVARDGHLLYPAFPYIHYTRMSDEDIDLAYGYLMSRAPVHVTQPPNALVFPLNFRPLLAFWNLLYLRPGPLPAEVPTAQPTPVARGRYLVDTLGHCASCHSGLNLMGGERRPAFQGGNIDGWDAPALTTLAQGSAPWRHDELVDYLRGGLSRAHGAAKGPMRPVAERMATVPREDVEAIVAYLMSIQEPAPAKPASAPVAAPVRDVAASAPDPQAARLFTAACAGCHAASAPMMRIDGRPGLARSSAVLGDRPDNFVQTVLHGIPWAPQSSVYMPPFASTLTDEQVGQLAAYVRTGLAAKPAWRDVAATSAKLRKESQP
ncbi:c-type cytochrome [Massilia sp. TN1-12]|uniref:c-type cytochrome n=1 Tax=Massilia paldalensis TaxID=3377675 RepID=UPI00384ECA96